MAYCTTCGYNLEDGMSRCPSCRTLINSREVGAERAGIVHEPPTATLPGPEEAESLAHGGITGRRILAALIDLLIVYLGLGILVGNLLDWPFWAWAISAIVYYFTLEMATDTTLGKAIMAIKVVKVGGGRPDWKSFLVRNILRIIDWVPGIYLVGIVSISFRKNDQRLGDIAADTIIVRSGWGLSESYTGRSWTPEFFRGRGRLLAIIISVGVLGGTCFTSLSGGFTSTFARESFTWADNKGVVIVSYRSANGQTTERYGYSGPGMIIETGRDPWRDFLREGSATRTGDARVHVDLKVDQGAFLLTFLDDQEITIDSLMVNGGEMKSLEFSLPYTALQRGKYRVVAEGAKGVEYTITIVLPR